MKLPEKWQNVVEKMVNTLFNKVIGENEKKTKKHIAEKKLAGKITGVQ